LSHAETEYLQSNNVTTVTAMMCSIYGTDMAPVMLLLRHIRYSYWTTTHNTPTGQPMLRQISQGVVPIIITAPIYVKHAQILLPLQVMNIILLCVCFYLIGME